MPKTKRWVLRVAYETDQVVRHTAATANTTLTDLVVDAAVAEADRVLADRTQFALDPGQWTRFAELLDRTSQENPGLEKLFAKPSVFSALVGARGVTGVCTLRAHVTSRDRLRVA